MSIFSTWRQRARLIKRDAVALWFALRDPRTPWYARLLAALVVAYALSPIDLIPDFIPVLGYLDDVILLPAGIALCVWLIPDAVMAAARARAAQLAQRPRNWMAAVVIVLIWVGLSVAVGLWAWRWWSGQG